MKPSLRPDASSFHQVSSQRLQNHFETSVPLPLLKATMAGLIRWIAVGKVLPLRSGAQNPEYTAAHFSCIPSRGRPRPSARRRSTNTGCRISP